MTKRIIIAMGHKRSRGKDQVATFMREYLNNISKMSTIESFAYPIKENCKNIFSFSMQQLYGDQKETIDERWGITPRKAFQDYGMKIRELFGSDIWVRSMEEKLKRIRKRIVIVSDLRFKEELQMLQKYEARLIRVDRDVHYISKTDDHISENDLNDFNDWEYVIDNKGNLDELRHKVNNIVMNILEKEKEGI